jgi:hypothetical protein
MVGAALAVDDDRLIADAVSGHGTTVAAGACLTSLDRPGGWRPQVGGREPAAVLARPQGHPPSCRHAVGGSGAPGYWTRCLHREEGRSGVLLGCGRGAGGIPPGLLRVGGLGGNHRGR